MEPTTTTAAGRADRPREQIEPKHLEYRPIRGSDGKHAEGPVARAIEEETAKIPSDMFLWAAAGAAAASLALQVMGKRHTSNFVAQWTPTILICGLYNKIVKTHGHDKQS